MKISFSTARLFLLLLLVLSCERKKEENQIDKEIQSIDLSRGDIALCGADNGQFGKVEFSLSCAEKVRADFNLATSLLHSFEYVEAEKVFAKVIDEDPKCVMAYWGVAMSNFHPLWASPTKSDLQKGSKIVALARSLESKSSRETEYLEAIATIYDDWDKLDHRTRARKFKKASERIYRKYPKDDEAAIFYALALRATADPSDKSFRDQRLAGEILSSIFIREPNHPGIAHYIIHTYDYPGLAHLGLSAARKYASIASASAHAQHMPSHIFTRLGLWDECIQSNINSIAAAQCYAQNVGIKGHWDEELHGMDYLVYAYLQESQDEKAEEQVNYLATIDEVFPINFKDAYSLASIPTRFALERKDWHAAAKLELRPANFPWDKFLWEKANVNFGRLLGAVHTQQLDKAKSELAQLRAIQTKLLESNENYKANLVLIQVMTSEAWIKFTEGQKIEGIKLMIEAATNEDATEKDSVTPGEVIPARELLGDMYLEMGDVTRALQAYEGDLKRHPGRFNGLYGAGLAEEKLGDAKMAIFYYRQLLALTSRSSIPRSQQKAAELFIRNSKS